VPIYRLLQEEAYGPDEMRVMAEAYESALHVLRLVDRHDPVTEVVAKKIIEIWGTGERDTYRIAALAFEQLDVPVSPDGLKAGKKRG
jgi:hypothetical protein